MRKPYKYEDLFGKKYPGSRLTVIDDNDALCRDKDGIRRKLVLNCICDCGNHVTVNIGDLISGNTRSCGCYLKDHPTQLIDLKGQKFDKLEVLERVGKKHHLTVWRCRCDCGNIIDVKSDALRKGMITACRTCVPKHGPGYKHGDSGTRLHKIYTEMVYRCTSDKSDVYIHYGARGIYVCDEWLDKQTGYLAFKEWALANGYADNLTIDRKDNDGPYAPWNCRWTTAKTQMNNTRQNVYITYKGVTRTRMEWCELLGANYDNFLSKERNNPGKYTYDEIIEYFMKKHGKLSYHDGQFYDEEGFIKLLPKLH